MRRRLSETLPYPLYALLGLALWAGSFAVMRYGIAPGVSPLPFGIALALCIPAALVVVWGIRMIFRPKNLVEATTLIVLVGLLIDGVLVGYFPFVYADDEKALRFALSWRVMSAGSLLLLAVLLEHRPLADKR